MSQHIKEFTDVVRLSEIMKSAELRKLLRKQVYAESVVASRVLGGPVRYRTEFIDGTRNFRAVWTLIS